MDFYRWVRTQWDRAGAFVAVVLGAVALLLGWRGTSNSTLPTEQIPYIISGGIFGLFALGIGATLWLSADLRDEWRKLDDIHKELRGDGPAQQAGRDPEPSYAVPLDSSDTSQFPAIRDDDLASGRGSAIGDSWQ